jgi:hypothetical protein
MNEVLLPHALADDRVAHLANRLLGRRAGPPAARPAEPPWGPAAFGLDGVAEFTQLDPEVQRLSLQRASDDLLTEALYIERAGMLFASRMATLAETVEERAMYATFAADEARHHHQIAGFAPDAPPTAFHGWLNGVVERASRPVLIAVVQVVLEGWGLHHYAHLADACTNPGLTTVLREILDDESWHHGSGVLWAQTHALSDAELDDAALCLQPLFDMVRLGPAGVAGAVAGACEAFGLEAPAGLWEALSPTDHVEARLSLLCSLLRRAGLSALVDRLSPDLS